MVEGAGATFDVPEENLPRLRQRLDKLARRAVKLGLTPPTYSVGEPRVERRSEEDLDGTSWTVAWRVYPVTVQGEAPKFDGWTFCAVRDHAEGGAPVLRSTGAHELPLRFREASYACEHCETRRARKETFVLRHDDGRWAQVGRQCIRDFLGHASPEQIAAQAELVAEACSGGSWEEASGDHARPTVEAYLQFVSCVIRHRGWTPRSRADFMACDGRGSAATADVAAAWLDDRRHAAKTGAKAKFPQPTQEDESRAAAATAWAAALRDEPDAPLSDYLHNLKQAALREVLTEKLAGLVASIVPAWDRECARRRDTSTSCWLGVLGERFKRTERSTKKRGVEVADTRLRVSVQSVRPFDGQFGTSYKNTCVTEAGDVVVWWGSQALATGWVYLLAGTVKSHGEWGGRKETTLTRCEAERVEFDVEAAVA
jgi:hypothetical protein